MPIAFGTGIALRRREAMALLLGCAIAAKADNTPPKPLARFIAPAQGAALLLDIASRRPIAAHEADVVAAPPGSTIKPFALAALLTARKLTEAEPFLCSGKLTVAGRQLNCSHPPLTAPMRVETAIAYSCNCFVAHMAERFAPGEFASTLDRAGYTRWASKACLPPPLVSPWHIVGSR